MLRNKTTTTPTKTIKPTAKIPIEKKLLFKFAKDKLSGLDFMNLNNIQQRKAANIIAAILDNISILTSLT